jgi:uracil-DNA glycosylase
MIGPVITGAPAVSPVMLVGQAPGVHEGRVGRPFGWTAGRTLFRWLDSAGLDEQAVRERVYMAAVCRCFPGKATGGGDRVPTRVEADTCARWLDAELCLLEPALVLLVGRLAIGRFLHAPRLIDAVGRVQRIDVHGRVADVLALPHPSGASTWHRTEPGRSLLERALGLLREHPAWRAIGGG